MKYLETKDILRAHSFIIDETGGSHGVRDSGVVEAATQAPRQSFGGTEQYPGTHEKAAVYLHRIIMNHPFVDGNKRTAVTIAAVFLEENGYEITAKAGAFEVFAVKVVEDRLEVPEIADWLKENSTKVSE